GFLVTEAARRAITGVATRGVRLLAESRLVTELLVAELAGGTLAIGARRVGLLVAKALVTKALAGRAGVTAIVEGTGRAGARGEGAGRTGVVALTSGAGATAVAEAGLVGELLGATELAVAIARRTVAKATRASRTV